MKKTIKISGMSCSACANGIEKAVNKLDGVIYASVSLLSKEMIVEFDEKILTEREIKSQIIKLGYGVENFKSNKENKFSEINKMRNRFVCSVIILLPLMYLCFGKILNFPLPKDVINYIIQCVLALTVMIINKKFFVSGIKAVINGSPNMDTLVSLGSLSAFVYSSVMTVLALTTNKEVQHVFFDASAMVLAIVTLGKMLEELSKIRTGDAVEKLGNLLPKTVTVLIDGKEKLILTDQINQGDLLLLRAGEYVPIDGIVLEGSAGIDKSAITGESMPQEVKENDAITSGSIIKEGYVIVKAEKVGNQTLFSKIVEIVKTASVSKAPAQKLADKISGIFVPIVTALSIITFGIWIIISGDLFVSFNYGISVLTISCPCALGLATPVAILVATGRSASEGVLFKNAEALQKLCKTDCVLLDKTATLTVGKPKVTDYENYTDESNLTIFPIVVALERNSSHPLATPIIEYCKESDKKVDNYNYIIGKGVIGEVDGVRYYLGNEDILPLGIKVPKLSQSFDGKSVIYLADDYQLISVFGLSDYLKEESKQAVQELNSMGIKTIMITGDNHTVAKKIAEQVNITEYQAQVLPEDKFEIVNKYKNSGYFVSMVGDGINDSPALKSADVGIAIGTGTDIAIDSSDVVLVNGSLLGVSKAVKLSKKCNRIIKQNLFWAFFYNALGIPIAGGALSNIGISLTPILSSLMMCVSSLFVVTNALRIAKKNNKSPIQPIIKENLHEIILTVDGMTCNHCVMKVKDALSRVNGVYRVKVELENKRATVEKNENVANEKLIKAVESAGFNCKVI